MIGIMLNVFLVAVAVGLILVIINVIRDGSTDEDDV